jgi:hypothetical protein
MTDQLSWSPREFATVTGFSRSYIYSEITAGRLRVVEHGSRVTILRDDGLLWLAHPTPERKEAQ